MEDVLRHMRPVIADIALLRALKKMVEKNGFERVLGALHLAATQVNESKEGEKLHSGDSSDDSSDDSSTFGRAGGGRLGLSFIQLEIFHKLPECS